MKKILILFAIIIVALAGFGVYEDLKGKADQRAVSVLTPAPQKKPMRELTYEERRDEAKEKIGGHKNGVLNNTVVVDLSPLVGKKLADLYAKYLGMESGPVPPTIKVSFDERMATMYNQKVEWKRCSKKDPKLCKVASDTVLSQAPELLRRYIESNKMKMNLKEFIAIADEKTALAKKSIDWTALCKSKVYRLNEKKCELLQAIVKNIRGKDMVAYGMTELLPSSEGETNVKYIDIILRNAGAQFLYYVPALGDGLASLGFYQFTFLALREDALRTEGSNVVSAYVGDKGEKIPGSVVALSGHQHHTAAFYFAVHNIASFLSRISPSQVATLGKIHNQHQDEMVILIACAHHAPSATFPVLAKWLDLKGKPITPKKVKKNKKQKVVKPSEVDIVPMFPKRLDMKRYAEKSRNNLLAVYALK